MKMGKIVSVMQLSRRDSMPLRALPLLSIYLTERCNSRCVSCDYWKHGRLDASLTSLERWLPSLAALGTQVVLITGGEPLLNPEWVQISQALRARGLRLWLLTSGLSLAKHANQVAELFESVTVSMDGTNPATYQAIRGLDAFDTVCAGVRAVAGLGVPISLRVTVQRANYQELPLFAPLARACGAGQVSFLAADVSTPHAFGRSLPDGFASDIGLQPHDLPLLERLLLQMETEQAAEFASGFIAESPSKLRRILAYFTARCGLGEYPPVRCNAPEFSAVVEAHEAVRPCFFIPGNGPLLGSDLGQTLNAASMQSLRAEIRAQGRAECARCVCSMWRDPSALEQAFGVPA